MLVPRLSKIFECCGYLCAVDLGGGKWKYLSTVQVLDTPVEILHVDEDLVVVNKPPSIPVHPIGRFRVS